MKGTKFCIGIGHIKISKFQSHFVLSVEFSGFRITNCELCSQVLSICLVMTGSDN